MTTTIQNHTLEVQHGNFASATGVLKFEVLRGLDEILKLEQDWDRLLEESRMATLSMRWDWIKAWLDEFSENVTPIVGVVRDVFGIVLAIAPMAICAGPAGPRKKLRHLSLLGSMHEAESERLDFLVPAGREEELIPLLCGIFAETRNEWDTVLLCSMPDESLTIPYIRTALAAMNAPSKVVSRAECQYMDLPATWAEYEAARSGNWRSKMRRKWKSLEEAGGQVMLAGRDMPVEEAMCYLEMLHAMHWPDGVSYFLRQKSLNFHRRIISSRIADGTATICIIMINGRPAGAAYGLREGGQFFLYQVGWHPGYAEYSVGTLAICTLVKEAIAQGANLFDLLPGEYNYKARWARKSRDLVWLEAFNPSSMRASTFHTLRGLKRVIGRYRRPAEM